MRTATYWGLASAHGLESFVREITSRYKGFDEIVIGKEDIEEVQKQKDMAYRSAYWNRHRHSVFYQAEVNPVDGKEIEAIMEEDPEEALRQLKSRAIKILIMDTPGSKKSWDLIPNKDLDPYS